MVKHEISSVGVWFSVCVCARVNTAKRAGPYRAVVSGDGQEEQHANTSANYDVELLHHRDAHLEFFKNGGWSQGGVRTPPPPMSNEPRLSVPSRRPAHGRHQHSRERAEGDGDAQVVHAA